MKTFTETIINKEDLDLFNSIELAINEMSNPKLGVDKDGEAVVLDSQMLAEAVSNIYGLKLQRGFYLGHDHAWSLTENGNIIDVYPVGIVGGPLLIDKKSVENEEPVYLIMEGPFIDMSLDKKYQWYVRLTENAIVKAMDKIMNEMIVGGGKNENLR